MECAALQSLVTVLSACQDAAWTNINLATHHTTAVPCFLFGIIINYLILIFCEERVMIAWDYVSKFEVSGATVVIDRSL